MTEKMDNAGLSERANVPTQAQVLLVAKEIFDTMGDADGIFWSSLTIEQKTRASNIAFHLNALRAKPAPDSRPIDFEIETEETLMTEEQSPPSCGSQEVREMVEHLMGPHEWGYLDLAEGGFISDGTPFDAAALIETLALKVDGLESGRDGLLALQAEDDAPTAPPARASEDGWRLIATAPRDGTRIIALEGDGIYPCSWRETEPDGEGGYDVGGWFDHGMETTENPTHWRPLPAPPPVNGETGA